MAAYHRDAALALVEQKKEWIMEGSQDRCASQMEAWEGATRLDEHRVEIGSFAAWERESSRGVGLERRGRDIYPLSLRQQISVDDTELGKECRQVKQSTVAAVAAPSDRELESQQSILLGLQTRVALL